MNCIVCGKRLVGSQRKYCCMAHAQFAFKSGKASQYKDNTKDVVELYERFKKAFKCGNTFYGNSGGKKMRIFIAACLELGYTTVSIANGINRHHGTISHHRYNTSEEEKQIARDFLANKNYVYGSKYNGFTYGAKQ